MPCSYRLLDLALASMPLLGQRGQNVLPCWQKASPDEHIKSSCHGGSLLKLQRPVLHAQGHTHVRDGVHSDVIAC